MKSNIRGLDGTVIDNNHDQKNQARYRLDDEGGLVKSLKLAKFDVRHGDSLLILIPSQHQLPGKYDVPGQSPLVCDIYILD